MTIDVKTITKEELNNLQYSKGDIVGLEYNNIIIIPINELHDSGFGCMKFVLLNHENLVGVIGGYSDVIHLWNGRFSIDCLPCGYLRVMLYTKEKVPAFVGSDFFVGLDK